MKLRLISIFITFFSVNVIAAEVAPAPTYGAVKLRTTIWPPYQMMLQGELSGESTETLRCIFRDINESFSVQVMPWQRAIQDMKHSVADGIFTSGPSPELDAVATMSAPFALEKWYWYHSKGLDLSNLNNLRIGAVRSSNQATWLDTEGIPVTELVNEGMQLVRLVQAGRIDTFIADSRYFEELVEEVSASSDFESDLQRTFVRYMPLGVYFADQFLQQHPEYGVLMRHVQGDVPTFASPAALEARLGATPAAVFGEKPSQRVTEEMQLLLDSLKRDIATKETRAREK